MEELLAKSEGEAHLHDIGFVEYFESFHDLVPHHENGDANQNSALSADEVQAILAVSRMVDAACDETPGIMSEKAFAATGWPARIQTAAKDALTLMQTRGRFSEKIEQDAPACHNNWP